MDNSLVQFVGKKARFSTFDYVLILVVMDNSLVLDLIRQY